MKRKIDYSMIGRRFGRLTILDFDHIGSDGRIYWFCECDCGTRKAIRQYSLTSGVTVSCGCYNREPDYSIIGERFGSLTVIDFVDTKPGTGTHWLCECDCGNTKIVSKTHLRSGSTTSCDQCFREKARQRATTHGMTDHPLFSVWHNMHGRCNNPTYVGYGRYGGRGISVCEEWDEFINFYEWAMSHGYERGLSIDRVDNDGDYCPENCRWTDMLTQGNNRGNNRHVTYAGETHTLAEWSRLLDVDYHALRFRISRNDMRDFEEYFGFREE